jgi:hypothetical protein
MGSTSSDEGGERNRGDSAFLVSPSCGLLLATRHGFSIDRVLDRGTSV